MDTGFTDCLVLKIQELSSVDNEIDIELFVLYDNVKGRYVLRGRRNETSSFEFSPFSFVSDSSNDVVDFISIIIYKKNLCNYTLYNYDNFPKSSDEITFESLESDEDVKYEIVGYDNTPFGKQWLLRMIRSLRNVYNC
jgi:hypothetical protein